MTDLVRAELRKALSRRLFRFLFLLVLGLVVLVGVVTFVAADDVTYARAAPGAMGAAADVLFTLALVVGASAVGAEWGTGSMATLLTWEPRRGRVMGAKTLSAALVASLASLVALVALALVLLPSAIFHGSVGGLDGPWWRGMAWLLARGAVLAVVAAAIGAGVASLFRNTAGAVGGWFIYFAVAEPLLVVWKPWLRGWLLDAQIDAFLLSGFYVAAAPRVQAFLGLSSVPRAGLLLGAYTAAAVAAGYAAFRSRDVT